MVKILKPNKENCRLAQTISEFQEITCDHTGPGNQRVKDLIIEPNVEMSRAFEKLFEFFIKLVVRNQPT